MDHAIAESRPPIARFRIKKKQKTLNLERTVSDLNGRVDELEQEAADLRRENGWLKEIVMLKSTRTPGQSSSAAGPSNTGKKAEKDSEEESDEDTDGGGNASKAKGKGKGKGKEKSR
ncbi:hypothetical protein FA95DRAFT_1553209 [Auriscalpium vulgare]|uniref:Uncharacterized protein n=1 Tax=Auriscalpium vulgare TaxID=40419 RepID=A0ACB8S9S6_9AGAM|nr:hypothetical protein FA95DRAFT_1553209 [Auriscalpium vulgare]